MSWLVYEGLVLIIDDELYGDNTSYDGHSHENQTG